MEERGIYARVRRTLVERRLVVANQKLLLACSGGPDSTVMLEVMAKLAPSLAVRLAAASVDHGLRPQSAAEVAAAGRLAARFGIPFAPLRLSIPPGASLMRRAREARYRCLRGEALRVGASAIAIGHTRDDQAETVLMRLLRGASLRGLAGIDPHRPDGMIRPLIDVSRASVLEHLSARGLTGVQDPSNRDLRFNRVRVRQRLLPRLAAEDPRVAHHLASLADDAREVRAMLEGFGRRALAEAQRSAHRLDRHSLLRAPGPIRRAALLAWLSELGPTANRAQVEALDRALQQGRGHVLLKHGWAVSADGDTLVARWESHPKSRSQPKKR